MADFEEFYSKLSVAEGGYVNSPNDSGGETAFGISRKWNPQWPGWSTIDQIKADYPDDYKTRINNNTTLKKLAKSFYKEGYWDIFDADEFKSQRVANQICDTAVNCGNSTAIKLAQRILGDTETGKWSTELRDKLMMISD